MQLSGIGTCMQLSGIGVQDFSVGIIGSILNHLISRHLCGYSKGTPQSLAGCL